MAGPVTCPYCGGIAHTTKQMSQNGWILFVVLILFCTPLCFLPFVMSGFQEDVGTCAGCGAKLAGPPS